MMTVAVSLMGCSESEPQAQEPDARPMLIDAAGGSMFVSPAYSRALPSASDDAESREAILPETCGLFGEMENYTNDIFYNQIVYRRDGALFTNAYGDPANTIKADIETQLGDFPWPTDNNWIYAPLRYWAGNRWFQFYCYAPHTSIDGASVSLTNNSYDAMNYFELSRIPPYSSYDYTVASRWVKQNNGSKPVPFKDDAKMIHASARICLRMTIGQQYSVMRDVRVKEVTVNDRNEGSYYQCRMTFDNTDQSKNTLTVSANGEYTSDPNATVTVIPIFNDPDGLKLLNTGYQQFGSLYVMPQTMTTLTINVTYDVYDTTDKTTPVRKDQRVSNTVTLKDPDTGKFLDVESGKYYEINIVVSPKYLYVLSDNDIVPDIIISPE